MSRASIAVLVLALAGCGGEDAQREAAPVLPAPLAERLAAAADAVAARLDASDPCGAAAAARALNGEAVAAVNTPAVPPELKEPLLSSVQELSDRAATDCAAARAPPPPVAQVEDEDDDRDERNGRGKKRGKGKKKGRGGEDD